MPSIDSISPLHPITRTNDMSIQPISTIRRPEASAIIDTIGPAAEHTEVYTPERPILVPPNELPPIRGLPLSDYRLIAAAEESRELGNHLIDTLGVRLAAVKTQIREISAENMQKLKETAERANSSLWWSTLKKFATALLSTFSIIWGTALVASGGGALIGGAMIASGILSLANFALTEAGTWDWVAKQLSNDDEEYRKKLAWILPAAIGVAAGAVGLVGSAYSLGTGAIQFAEKAVYIAQSALALFDGLTTIGKGQADARLLWTQADLKHIEAKLTVERTNFDSVMREIEGSLNDFRAVKQKTKKTIQIISQSNSQLMKQV
jgi:hypothetical protein